MDLAPSHTLHLHPLHQATLLHLNLYLLLHLVAVVSSEDFEDSEVAQAVGVQLAAVLVAEVATPGVVSVYPQALEHWDMDKVRYRTPAALRMEANRTPDLALLDFPANIQGDLADFELVPTLVVAPPLPAPEGLEQEGFVRAESKVEAIVGQLGLEMVGFVVDVVALGQSSAVGLVEVVVRVDIVEETFDYSAEQVSDAVVFD